MIRLRQPFTFLFPSAAAFALAQTGFAQSFGPEQVVTDDANGAYCVFATDLDGDGDPDLLSASQSDNKIARYENLGGGSFGPQQVITTSAVGAVSVYATDLDGDGDADVLSASGTDNMIAWYENLGAATFGPQRVITLSAFGAHSVYAADLDGDGDADVLSASDLDDKIAWYENRGGGVFGGQQVLTNQANEAASVYAADLDGDGDSDVLSASFNDDKIAWYENLGGGAFGPQSVITAAADGAYSVFAEDVDGDGRVDVLSASLYDGTIAWYQNLGGGAFGSQHVIATAGGINFASSVYANDLDGDGDPDVLSAVGLDDAVVWYRNDGTGLFGVERVISTLANGSRCVFAADLDGDGDADVLSASTLDDEIAWYENLGSIDCNGNGVPDDDEIVLGTAVDCDQDGALDQCEIGLDQSIDLNQNGRLDRCEFIGSNYCSPAVLNSSGEAAQLLALGSEILFFADVTLAARGLPQNTFAMFFCSQTQGYAFPVPSSQGALCVVGLVGRYSLPGQIMSSGGAGTLFFPIDALALPTPTGFVVAQPGETWNFQAWFRDNNPGTTSNFTDAVSITFQ